MTTELAPDAQFEELVERVLATTIFNEPFVTQLITEAHNARGRVAEAEAERDQARAEIDRQRHEREKYTERWDALDLQRLAALELHALPFCETCNDHGPCETRRALDGDGVTACTGCETCSVCRARGLHRWEAIATVRPGHVETTPGSTPLTLAQAAGHLHDWARDLADGTRTDWPAGHPDIIHGIRAAADWLDARAAYETETREQHLTAVREAGKRLGESFQHLGEAIRDGAAKARAAREQTAAEMPDVDGWTIYPTTDGGLMVSHDTDADRPVLAADDSIPLAAVLAFIADADDATEGDPK
jgi:hypothetical protein